MILQKMPHYVDSILTQEDASAALQDGQVVVGLYTTGRMSSRWSTPTRIMR